MPVGTVSFFSYCCSLMNVCIWVHADNSTIYVVRLAQPVVEGGHNVPVDKIHARISRTIGNVQQSLPLCDEVWVLDNTLLENPYRIFGVRVKIRFQWLIWVFTLAPNSW
jgi:predicted ABC-type ATPase